jgi:5-methylcytosine-specific restriction protein A
VPNRAMRFCSWPGCNLLTNSRYCPEHQVQADQRQQEADRQYNKERGSAAERGYDVRWQKVRCMKLRGAPLCEMCEREGRVVPAVLVHHIRALSDGGAKYDPGNLMSVCQMHHEQIHGHDRWKARTNHNT